jgi:hypothetical protein
VKVLSLIKISGMATYLIVCFLICLFPNNLLNHASVLMSSTSFGVLSFVIYFNTKKEILVIKKYSLACFSLYAYAYWPLSGQDHLSMNNWIA